MSRHVQGLYCGKADNGGRSYCVPKLSQMFWICWIFFEQLAPDKRCNCIPTLHSRLQRQPSTNLASVQERRIRKLDCNQGSCKADYESSLVWCGRLQDLQDYQAPNVGSLLLANVQWMCWMNSCADNLRRGDRGFRRWGLRDFTACGTACTGKCASQPAILGIQMWWCAGWLWWWPVPSGEASIADHLWYSVYFLGNIYTCIDRFGMSMWRKVIPTWRKRDSHLAKKWSPGE